MKVLINGNEISLPKLKELSQFGSSTMKKVIEGERCLYCRNKVV